MARIHGSVCRVYWAQLDLSGEIGSIDVAATADTHDRTTFADAGVHTSDPGLLGWTATFEGFYDAASGTLARGMESNLGLSGTGVGILSIFDGNADAVGDRGILGSEGVLTQRGQPARVADLVRLSGAFAARGRVGIHAVLLHPNGLETVTGTGTSVNNGASSANGGRGNFHILPPDSVTGTWTLKVQHSTNDSVWSDLITFTQIGATWTQSVEVTGTVNQYLRASWTEDASGSIRFVMGFARY